MRIGLIIYGQLDHTSGGYLYDRKLVEHLRQHGHEVEMFSLPAGNYFRHLTDNSSEALLRRLQNAKLDLLLQDELNHASLAWLNARLKKRVVYPLVSIVHHLRNNEQHPRSLKYIYRQIEKRYLQSVDAFILNSNTTRQAVEQLIGATKPCVVAQPGGDRLGSQISAAEIEQRVRQLGPLRVVFLGNLIRRKAPHLLIEAAAMLQPGMLHLTFVGSADSDLGYARKLKRAVERHELEPFVEFCGYLEPRELAPRLRASQVLAVPSAYEGFGIAYVEGMGFGLPAIGTRSGAAGEIITHGKNGYLIEVGDAGELAAHLARLHQDRQFLVVMSLAARQHYERRPTWETSLSSIEAFLFPLIISNQPVFVRPEAFMSESSTRFMLTILTVFTAVVHLVILNLGGLQILFLLNGLGYFALLGALLLRFPRNQQVLLHYAYMAYALATIIAWVVVPGTRDALGYSTKLVEVLLIVFLWMNLKRVQAMKA